VGPRGEDLCFEGEGNHGVSKWLQNSLMGRVSGRWERGRWKGGPTNLVRKRGGRKGEAGCVFGPSVNENVTKQKSERKWISDN